MVLTDQLTKSRKRVMIASGMWYRVMVVRVKLLTVRLGVER